MAKTVFRADSPWRARPTTHYHIKDFASPFPTSGFPSHQRVLIIEHQKITFKIIKNMPIISTPPSGA